MVEFWDLEKTMAGSTPPQPPLTNSPSTHSEVELNLISDEEKEGISSCTEYETASDQSHGTGNCLKMKQ